MLYRYLIFIISILLYLTIVVVSPLFWMQISDHCLIPDVAFGCEINFEGIRETYLVIRRDKTYSME